MTTQAELPMAPTSIATETPPPAAAVADWKVSLPEDMRTLPAIQDYKDVAGLVKSHVNLQGMIGQDKIPLINDKSTPEQVAEFYTKLGRPAKPEEYKLPVVKFPNGGTIPEPAAKHFMGVFHKHGLSQKQAEGLMTDFADFEGKTMTERAITVKASQEQSVASLKTEWGDAYAEKLAAAQTFVKTCGSPELSKWLNETGLGNDANFIKMFSNAGMMVLDDKAVGGGGMKFTKSPDQAKTEIDSLKKDKDFIMRLTDKNHPTHKDAKDAWDNLHQKLSAGQPRYVGA